VTSIDVTVTVEPKAGFKGDAALTVTGLPTGATATFAPATVTLNTTPVTSKMTITVPVTAAPSAPNTSSAITVKAAGANNVSATAPANFKINPKLTMTIPVNSTALIAASTGATTYVDGWAGPALGAAPQALQTQVGNPIQIVVINKDSTARVVHGNAGFIHGDTANPVAPNATDPKVRTIAAGTSTSGYIHGVSNAASGNAGVAVAFQFSAVQTAQ
jgi:hypothetical protein